jgi:hypothetical protein
MYGYGYVYDINNFQIIISINFRFYSNLSVVKSSTNGRAWHVERCDWIFILSLNNIQIARFTNHIHNSTCHRNVFV